MFLFIAVIWRMSKRTLRHAAESMQRRRALEHQNYDLSSSLLVVPTKLHQHVFDVLVCPGSFLFEDL